MGVWGLTPLPPSCETLRLARGWPRQPAFSHPDTVASQPSLAHFLFSSSASSKCKSGKGTEASVFSELFPSHLCETSESLLMNFILEGSVVPEKAGHCDFLIHKMGLRMPVSQRHYGAWGVSESSPKSRIKGHMECVKCICVMPCRALGSAQSFRDSKHGCLLRGLMGPMVMSV